ncbi:MAG: group II intron reverse transcriptase/maturase [Deltaproteobacteria bacterium]|nr:MAG: group II intron reverse transcriptase/maturase [Deltaproteobacteria bacterium]
MVEKAQRAGAGKPRMQPSQKAYVGLSAMCSGLGRVREAAKRDPKIQFTSLLHHLTKDLLIQGFKALNKKSAVGVDDETWQMYSTDYVNRISDLHARIHRGAYRAKPSKRIYIEKDDGRKRPIGIAALEDKIVQQATTWLLEAIYEERFLSFSYGFRPGRSQHNALDAIYVAIEQRKVNWVFDADIEGFFDNLNHEWMIKFLEHCIGDPRLIRLIRKWLKAGVSEDGQWLKTEVGTPQGATISPILANIYLHYVLDLWVEQWRKRNARGEVYIVRYADDFVMGFQYESDAKAFNKDLVERLEKFGLRLHPKKTRLIKFGRFAEKDLKQDGKGSPETFEFLGFTHYCGRTRKGKFAIKRKTSKKKMRNSIQRIKTILRKKMHYPLPIVGAWLRLSLRGHFNYYGVPGNRDSMDKFRTTVARTWIRVLQRRSQKGKSLNWSKMAGRITRWLPRAKVTHPYPNQRFCVNT